MELIITSISPSHSGEEVEIKAEGREGFSVQKFFFCIATEFYAETSLPFSLSGPVATDVETVKKLDTLSLRTDAVKKGISLLSFSENTAKGLYQKLILRGCSKSAASEAVSFLTERGFINESAQAKRLTEDMAYKKLYGLLRIRKELYAKGFSEKVVSEATENCEIDFAALCRKRILMLGGIAIFSEQKSRIRAVASLSRYGFSYSEIRQALGELKK